MLGVFAAATARLTPEFLESFDPEKLASKFVKVEKEFGVKFTKSKTTFNIIGQWEAVRNAHKSLQKLKFNEKHAEKYQVKGEKYKEKKSNVLHDDPLTKIVSKTDECDNNTKEKDDTSEGTFAFVRGKGNPKRGRYTTKESKYSTVPEPVFFLQYQDKTFTDADSLDIDAVLEDFEKSQHDKKVTKEDLKKIFEKNKDQMGKPLEKGIPKGAIIPVPKSTDQNSEGLGLDSASVASTSAEEFRLYHNGLNSYNYIKSEPSTQNTSVSGGEGMMPLNSGMITTYSVNARMSTYNMEMATNENQESVADRTTVGQINLDHFYIQEVGENERLVTGMLAGGNSSASGQMQLPESETDSFCDMFVNYDPQAMLNPITPSTSNLNMPEGEVAGLQPVDAKSGIYNADLLDQSESSNDSIKKESVSNVAADILTSSTMTSDGAQLETNGINVEMNSNDKACSPEPFEELTEMSENSRDVPSLQKNSATAVNCSLAKDARSDNFRRHISRSEIDKNKESFMNPADSTLFCQSEELSESVETLNKTKSVANNATCMKQKGSARETLSFSEITNSMVTQKKNIPLEMQDNTRNITTECQQQEKRDVNMACDKTNRSTEMTSDIFEEVEKDLKSQDLYMKTEDSISENTGTKEKLDETPHISSKNIAAAENIKRSKSKKCQDNTGKVTPVKNKMPRQSGIKGKVKAPEKTDNVKKRRGRKPHLPVNEEQHGTDNSTSENIASNDTVAEAIEKEASKDIEPSKEKESDIGDTERSIVNEIPKKKQKQKERKASSDIKEKQIYKCTECDYQGYRKKRLAEHMGRVHGLLSNGTQPQNPMFTCDECEKTFVFEKDLNRHKKIVHHGQVFVCLICNKTYKSKYVFDRHTATHEEGYVQPKFRCQICEREFTTKFSMSSHIKSEHLGMKKTYSCPTCGKTFSQIRSYRQHANVHAGIRPYVCEVCGKSFTYDKSLKEHRYMHDSVRRFQCTVCLKTFRQQTCLLIHMKTHKEKKDHICSVCGREFTQKQSLLRHERIHTGDKPYSCKICFKSFGDYAVIRKHVMMAHKKSKDSWKNDIFTEEKKRSSHYIDGGPGYVPRESYAKVHENAAAMIPVSALEGQIPGAQTGQENHIVSDPLQQGFVGTREEYIHQRQLDGERSTSSQNAINTLPNLYQPSIYPGLDYNMMEAQKPKEQETYTQVVNVPVNYSLVQNIGSDAFNNTGSQQQNINLKSYPYSLTISPVVVKGAGDSGDTYATQFLNPPTSVSAVSMDSTSVSMTQVQNQMVNATNDSPVSMATSNSGWGYQGYASAYFSPASFSHYQSSPDT